jgi:hypothetical protein
VDHRNVNALLMAFTLYQDVEVILAPFNTQANPEVIEFCVGSRLRITVQTDLELVASELDAVYWNWADTSAHVQLVKERNWSQVAADEGFLHRLDSRCVILNSTQRTDLLKVDTTIPRCAGYRQAENGLFARMAMFLEFLGY